MARKRYNEEDIMRLLREIEVHLHGGMDVLSACRTAGISDKTYYGWRKRYGVDRVWLCQSQLICLYRKIFVIANDHRNVRASRD